MSKLEDQKNVMSRRGMLTTSALSSVVAFAAGCGAGGSGPADANCDPSAATDDGADLVLINGRIHTMDGTSRVVTSVAVKNKRFASVGDDAQARNPKATVVDLGGRTVIPGIVEAHVHIVSLANRVGYHTPIETTSTIVELQQVLARRRAGGVPEGQWITAMGGWHPNQFTDVRRMPTRSELDAAVSDRPVILFRQFTGPCVVNSMAKAWLETVTSPLAGPVAVGDDGTIAANLPSTTALYHLRVRQTFDDKVRSTLDAMAFSASVGVTAHLDETLFPTPGPLQPTQALSNLDQYKMYDSWLHLHRQERSFVRLQMNFLQNQNDPALPELHERLRNQFQFFGDPMMMTGSIGEWAAPIGAGAVWQEAQRVVAQAQWRNENAVSTLAQLEQVVSAYEACDAEFGIKGLRWMVHHVPFVTPELLTRLKNLEAAVQMAAFRWVSSGATDTAVGPSFRTIVDHGIKTGIHGDGVHIAPLNPFTHIYYAVTGLNSFGVQVNAGQQLTREEALRLFTRENAWFLRMEDKIGSIENGKLADLLVLDRDYFSVPAVEIPKVRPVLTLVDGVIVHETGALGTHGGTRRDYALQTDSRGRWD
ncbi:MAG: amidohydrolase family protein [Rubrivivax sp.]